MRAWVIEVGEPLPIDLGRPRLMRAGLLIEELARRGHDVVWFSSAFDHHAKSMRPTGSHVIELGDGTYELRLLRALGYHRNISVRRIIDHMVNARSFRRLARRSPPPDVICVGLPTLELAGAATRFGRMHDVPVCVDIRDLWPDIFERALPKRAQPIARFVLLPLHVAADRTCRTATSIVGVSEAFLDWGLRRAGRARRPSDRVFNLAFRRPPEGTEPAGVERFWTDHGVDPSKTLLAFVGTFNSQFDFGSVTALAAEWSVTRPGVQFVLCGVGPRPPLPTSDNVVKPGWIDSDRMSWLLRRATVGLAPYRSHPDFEANYPNKIVEYLAWGLPVVTTLRRGITADLLTEHGCGIPIPDTTVAWGTALGQLIDDEAMQRDMSYKAHDVFVHRFDAAEVYAEYASMLEALAVSGRGS